MKQRYTVNWRIEGAFTVRADNPQDAQDKFDEAWDKPSGIMPLRDGEISNDDPVVDK